MHHDAMQESPRSGPDAAGRLAGLQWAARADMAMRVCAVASELRIFDAICEVPECTCEELAGRVDCDPVGLQLILQSLVAMRLVAEIRGDGQEAIYAAGDGLREQHGDVAALIDFWREERLLWDSLAPQLLRQQDRVEWFFSSEQRVASYAAYLLAVGSDIGSKLERLPLRGTEKFLDVGSGPGAHAIELQKMHPDLALTVVDYPEVIVHTRAALHAAGLGEDVRILEGRFFDEEWRFPDETDVAWISGTLHVASPAACEGLLRRLFDSLKPGGRVWIHELCVPPTSLEGALLNVQLYLATTGGQLHSADSIEAMLSAVGFVVQPRVDCEGDETLLSGSRP